MFEIHTWRKHGEVMEETRDTDCAEITGTLRAKSGDLRFGLYEHDGEEHIIIVAFYDRVNTGRVLFKGPFRTLVTANNSLLEHMMFEHAQKMLTGEAA